MKKIFKATLTVIAGISVAVCISRLCGKFFSKKYITVSE